MRDVRGQPQPYSHGHSLLISGSLSLNFDMGMAVNILENRFHLIFLKRGFFDGPLYPIL